jgi:hypothetical protein
VRGRLVYDFCNYVNVNVIGVWDVLWFVYIGIGVLERFAVAMFRVGY